MAARVNLYLSRRNLETLLEKLDAVQAGRKSNVTLIKRDVSHPTHPMGLFGEGVLTEVWVTGVEDEVYYTDRQPGAVAKV